MSETEPKAKRPFFRAADDHDEWEWRRRLRANPTTRAVLRTLVALVGLVLILGGFALVPLPGPGWLIVILGLAVWASEIEPAADLLEWVKKQVRSWEEWVRRQPLWVKGLVGLLTFVFVLAVVWLALHVTGVPTFLPDGIEGWLQTTAGL